MKHECCDLFKIIPKKEIDRVFNDDDKASAQMD